MNQRLRSSFGMVCLLALTACEAPSSAQQQVPPAADLQASHASPLDTLSKSGPAYATYLIDGEPITLSHGRATQPAAPDSAIAVRTSVWEGPFAYGDLDADGDDDAALVLVQDLGGSGLFSYLAAAIHKDGVFEGGETVFLGDRIGPPAVRIRDGMIEVQFSDHDDEAYFGAAPSVDRIVRARVTYGALEELNSD
jgi:hypothetical protein